MVLCMNFGLMLRMSRLSWLGLKLIGRILFVASPVVLIVITAVSIITNTISTKTHMKQAKEVLRVLESSKINSVILSPCADPSSLIQDTVIIQDVATITRLVADYSVLNQYSFGQGRLPGSWQVKVAFLLNDGSRINSYVYHNDFSDMVFIPTKELNNGIGLDSYFATDSQQDIGKLLEKYR